MTVRSVSSASGGRQLFKMALTAGMASYLGSSIIVSVGIAIAIWQISFVMSAWAVGIVSGGLTLAIAAGALVGGPLADRFGHHRIFNIAIIVFALGAALMALASNADMLVLAAVIGGFSSGAALPASVALLSERAPQDAQARLVSFTQVMWTVGIAGSMGFGFVFSGLGLAGVRIIFTVLALTGLITFAASAFGGVFGAAPVSSAPDEGMENAPSGFALARLFRDPVLRRTTVLIILFYICWGLLANTFGQFQNYFLVMVSGASQPLATGLSVAIEIVVLALAVFYVRLVDTRFRNPVFYAGAAAIVVAMVMLAVSGGSQLGLVIIGLCLYQFGCCFAGEATYKVWTQESFPARARASALGLSYAVSRFVCAGFAFVTPSILAASASLFLWTLAGLALAALVFGAGVIANLNHRGIVPGPRHAASAMPKALA
ncbi:MFS transporter [Martelella sp. HB161492]|uniref:MFS transporter n=1 Tax=Martelella sp. HB161492 TaxID=2720726 RepID=UPI001590B9A0|nr:MFS transporter [Martelella sp. HB161492]